MSNNLQIVTFPAAILKKKSKPIKPPFSRWQLISEQMFALMYKLSGIGLAANQVGLDHRIFVMDVPAEDSNEEPASKQMPAADQKNLPANKQQPLKSSQDELSVSQSQILTNTEHKNSKAPSNPLVCINPQLLSGHNLVSSNEGCLSIPDINASLYRYQDIKVSFYNLQGKKVIEHFQDLEAFCFQHELDHLNGILFWDRLDKLERNNLKEQYTKSINNDKTSASH